MATGATSVLRKKLSKIQSRGYNFPVQNQLASKVEYAATRGATAVLEVAVEAFVSESRVTRLSSLIDTLPMPGLFVIMNSMGGDVALAGLDMGLVDHVVDIIAGGDPNNSESLPTRKPTTLDAGLCVPLIDAIMDQLYGEIEALSSDVKPQRFECGQIENIPTNLNYLLPDQQYLSIGINLDIGENARSGDFQLVLPLSWIEPIEGVLRRVNSAPAHNDTSIWPRHMRNVVRRAPLKLTAVIDSIRMEVSEVSRLETGELFPLPGISLDDVRLELNTGSEKRIIARGRLGAHKHYKAIKVLETFESEAFDLLAQVLAED